MKYAPLNELCTIQSGGTPSRSNTNYWKSPDIPWVKISDIKGKHITETEEYISNEGLSNSSAKIFPSGTILYTIFATLGEVGILDIDAATNQAIAGLTITSNKIKRDYLYYYLQSIKRKVANLGRGVAQNNINMGILKQLEVPLYPPDMQSAIVCKLTYVEQLISNRKQALTTLDALVKSRFVEMFGDPVTNPMKWPTKRFKDICTVGSSKRVYQSEQTSAGVPFLRVSDLISKIASNTETCDLYISEQQFNEFKQQGLVPNAGDILVTARGTLGQCYIIKPEDKFYFQDGMISWVHTSEAEINPVYVSYLFDSQSIRQQIDRVVSGTTVAYLSIAQLSNFDILLPAIELQNQFADFVALIDKSKFAIQQSIDTLQTLKAKLMQDYFG